MELKDVDAGLDLQLFVGTYPNAEIMYSDTDSVMLKVKSRGKTKEEKYQYFLSGRKNICTWLTKKVSSMETLIHTFLHSLLKISEKQVFRKLYFSHLTFEKKNQKQKNIYLKK